MIQEIVDGLDIHSANAINLFGDVKYRQEAKILTFRMIYGGSAYAFYMDHKMPSFSKKKWEGIVDDFYTKYKQLKYWQDSNYRLVCKQGWYEAFTGRRWVFDKIKQHNGALGYNRPSVCNYIVQGVSTGDIVPLCMITLSNRLKRKGFTDAKIINQVHDSIVLDVPTNDVQDVAKECRQVFQDIPKLVKSYWNYDWVVPMDGEVKAGFDWGNMEKLK
jgi:DNA polymerase I-like protein with 3'-5' exonuclease and polymerase domains